MLRPPIQLWLPACVLGLATVATGQWSSSPANNLALADSPGGQTRPKVIARADGGCYVSWLDSAATGHDLRLQRLDVGGHELWQGGGILVADRQASQPGDYGITVDSDGFAVLTFSGGSGAQDEILAARVSPGGSLAWGSSGVQVSGSSPTPLDPPRIAALGQRGTLVAWSDDGRVHASGLNRAGTVVWTHSLPAAGPQSADLLAGVCSTGSTAILSIVHRADPSAGRQLHALQLDSSGQRLWHRTVFDGGDLPADERPAPVPDGLGGALFGWSTPTPGAQCFVQHIRSDGSELLPHNGVPVSTDGTQQRSDPFLDHDVLSGTTYVFWVEQNAAGTLFGLFGQKFDSSGQAQWAPGGEPHIPLGSLPIQDVRAVANTGGAFVFWRESPNPGADILRGRHVDGAGVTDLGPFDMANTPSPKSLPGAILEDSGQAVLAWSDGRNDPGDILIQNVTASGLLGNQSLGGTVCFGLGCPCGNDGPQEGCLNSTGQGATLLALGTTGVAADNLVLFAGQLPPGRVAVLFAGPGLLAGGSSQPFGDGLLCLSGPLWRLGAIQTSATGSGSWGPGLISGAGWVSPGDTRGLQVGYRDPQGSSCGTGFNVSHGVFLGFGQ